MAKARSLVGLDVHASKVVAAVLDAETGELTHFRMGGDAAGAAGFCAGLPGPVQAAYEAGPTGYGLARELAAREVGCVVAAPSKIPRGSGDRVKTDRRDAEHLARLLLAGKLHPVRVPGDEEEALRDLVRAREGVRVDLMRCRARLSKLLLRHGIRFQDGRAWTERHRQWLRTVAFDWPAAQATLLDAVGAVDALDHRRDQLEREIIALLPASPWAAETGRLRCLRGVDTLTAVGLCAEIGDFSRFAKAGQLMSYIGLTPSEDSTGEQRRLGQITKTGSGHARRLLVEASWHYRKDPVIGKALGDRQAGQPPEAIAIAWTAQRRLHRVWTRMEQRNKRRTLIAVAVAHDEQWSCGTGANRQPANISMTRVAHQPAGPPPTQPTTQQHPGP
jgi:transposase